MPRARSAAASRTSSRRLEAIARAARDERAERLRRYFARETLQVTRRNTSKKGSLRHKAGGRAHHSTFSKRGVGCRVRGKSCSNQVYNIRKRITKRSGEPTWGQSFARRGGKARTESTPRAAARASHSTKNVSSEIQPSRFQSLRPMAIPAHRPGARPAAADRRTRRLSPWPT